MFLFITWFRSQHAFFNKWNRILFLFLWFSLKNYVLVCVIMLYQSTVMHDLLCVITDNDNFDKRFIIFIIYIANKEWNRILKIWTYLFMMFFFGFRSFNLKMIIINFFKLYGYLLIQYSIFCTNFNWKRICICKLFMNTKGVKWVLFGP